MQERPGTILHRLVERVEAASVLDPAVHVATGVVGRLLPRGPAREVLSGTWLGHPLHPVAAMGPIGLWSSGSLMDLAGQDDAADVLVAAGVLAAAPAIASGWSDWYDMTAGPTRRLGVVHAVTNAAGTTLFASSLVARFSGRRGRGRALALAGTATIGLGGFLGGHLAYVRGVGINREAFDERAEEWSSIDGHAARVTGDHAVGDRCTHCGTRLDPHLTCPRDGSIFRAEDGAVVKGPATTPLPRYEIRRTDGRIEIRSPQPLGVNAAG